MLSLSNVSKSFGDKKIFSNFSYDFDTGVYVVRGESGIGKTTLLRMIAGIDKDYDGQINGGGPENVSMVFQEYRLFPWLNALKNVLLAFDEASEKDIALSKKTLLSLNITEDEMLLMPSAMSGGMKLRVSLARALVKASSVLLLDEPTRELNRELVEKVCSILSNEAKSKTVIIVTHDDIEGLFPSVTTLDLKNLT